MEYVHIKNIEKYHPGYKDRNLLWCKVYFTMVTGDPEFEMLNEIDQMRFIKFIILELQAKKPIPVDEKYLITKGFNLKKRPISLTLQMLHNFIEVDTVSKQNLCIEVDKEVDKEKNKNGVFVTEFFDYFVLKTKKSLKLTPERRVLIERRLKEGRTLEELKQAVDNFINDDWPERHKFIDLVYCIGIRNKIDNLDKWLNAKLKNKPQSDIKRPEPINEEEHKKVSELIHQTAEKLKSR